MFAGHEVSSESEESEDEGAVAVTDKTQSQRPFDVDIFGELLCLYVYFPNILLAPESSKKLPFLCMSPDNWQDQ